MELKQSLKEQRRKKDKSSRATISQVLDPRTLKVIQKLERQLEVHVNGCVATGKEGNIYTAKKIQPTNTEHVADEMEKISLESDVHHTNKTSPENDVHHTNKNSPESNVHHTNKTSPENDEEDKNKNSTEDDEYYTNKIDIPEEVAFKVYKTSVMAFKDRSRYVEGEHRLRFAYVGNNSRKMVAMWAEKEFRNLKRLEEAKIKAPKAYLFNDNVVVLSLIGNKGWPAPKLKHVTFSKEEGARLYRKCVNLLKNMYHKARVVHGDFNEFNILYYDDKLYVIDVGQAIDTKTENAEQFLREDCKHITDFFVKRGVETLDDTDLYDLIISKGRLSKSK